MKRGTIAAALLACASPAWSQPQPPAAIVSEARDMFGRLIAFPTVKGKGSVPAMVAFLTGEFRKAGFAEADIETVPQDETMAMIVRFRGAPGSSRPPVLFLAHMDVVDARKEEWATDPWVLTEKDGALYGRGVVDNKMGVLTLAQAFMRLKREGFVPDRELIIAFSGDEETGMATTRLMAERLKGAAYALNSDAGGGFKGKDGAVTYAYQAAEKTYTTYEISFRNKGGHSSRPRKDNAIYSLAEALRKIAEHRFPVRWNDVTLESFRALAPTLDGRLKTTLDRFVAKPGNAAALAVIAADPEFQADLRTTCVTTMLRAGIVENALPTEATATVNCRIFPGETVAGTQATLARVIGDKEAQFKVLGAPVESPVSALPDEARKALEAVLAVRATGASVSPYLEAGGTDGLRFRAAGIPTIGVGPLIATADSNYNFHGINERVPLSEFVGGLDHYYLMIKALAGPR